MPIEITWDVAGYILCALSLYAGVRGLIKQEMSFGGEQGDQPDFRVSGRSAQIIGALSLVSAIVVLFNLILGLICIVITSALASILKD